MAVSFCNLLRHSSTSLQRAGKIITVLGEDLDGRPTQRKYTLTSTSDLQDLSREVGLLMATEKSDGVRYEATSRFVK